MSRQTYPIASVPCTLYATPEFPNNAVPPQGAVCCYSAVHVQRDRGAARRNNLDSANH